MNLYKLYKIIFFTKVNQKNVRKIFILFLIFTLIIDYYFAISPKQVTAQVTDESEESTQSANLENLDEYLKSLEQPAGSIEAEINKIKASSIQNTSIDTGDGIVVSESSANTLRPHIKKLIRTNFGANESIKIEIANGRNVNVSVKIFDKYDNLVEAEIGESVHSSTKNLTIYPPDKLKPGQYSLEVTDSSGQVMTQNFTWGVLALNPNKSIYSQGETANLAIAVLNSKGQMVCDAEVTLQITDPSGSISTLSTQEGSIKVNKVCEIKELTLTPDFEAQISNLQIGDYDLVLVAETPDGIYSISDKIKVFKSPQFDIERVSATRIYPPLNYPVLINIEATEDFKGQVIENVPVEFEILESEDGVSFDEEKKANKKEVAFETNDDVRGVLGIDLKNASDEAKLNGESLNLSTVYEETKEIVWNVDLKKGEKITLSYIYKAPEISPQFYTTGPLKVKDQNNEIVFSESRSWQIAVDATNKFMAFWDGGAAPTGWVCVSCTGGDPFFQVFPRGAAAAGGTGGAATHTHTQSFVSLTNPSTTTLGRGGQSSGTTSTHTHAYTAGNGGLTASATNLPVFQNLKIIRYDTVGDPPDIPSGVIVMFDADPGSGWTRYSAQDNDMIRGENDATTTGGAATHTHTFTGTLNATSNTDGRTGTSTTVATAAHTHTVSGTTDASDHTPLYHNVLLYKNTSGSAKSLVGGEIFMSDGTLDTGWTSLSGSGGDFENRFIRGASTYAGTGGAANHTPSNKDTVSGAPSATFASSTGNPQNSLGGSAHTHTVTNSFGSADNLPPYRDVIVAKKDAPPPILGLVQEGYIFENDDGTSVDTNTQQAGSEFSSGKTLTDVKKGERITLRTHLKNQGTGALDSNLGLFYDRNDGIWTKVGSDIPLETGAGDCTDTNFNCSTIDGITSNVGSYSSLAISPSGIPWVSYYDSSAASSLKVAWFVGSGGNCDGNTAWNCIEVDNSDSVGEYSQIAFDSNGTPWIAYFLNSSELRVAWLVGSGGNCTNSSWNCTTVDTSSGLYLDIAIDSGGNPWISYRDLSNTALKVAWFVGSGGDCVDSSWNCALIDDGGGVGVQTGFYTSIAFDPVNNIPWISYYDFTNSTLRVAQYVGSNGDCTNAEWECTSVDDNVGGATDTGRYSKIAFDPAGQPWISYYDLGSTSLKVATKNSGKWDPSGTCSDSEWQCDTVDNSASVGEYNSIAFDPSGNPWISYYENFSTSCNDTPTTECSLRLARFVGSSGNCNNTSWSCGAVENPTTTGDVGSYSSLAFAPDGKAWISYYDATNTALKIASLNRGGEITVSAGLAGSNGDTISESHADMSSATDTTERDDTSTNLCISASTTWNNGKWSESEEIPDVSLPNALSGDQCTEVAWVIDTSQAVEGTTYRFVVASKDGWREDKGVWKGPVEISTDAYPTLTIESSTTTRYSKDNGAVFASCTGTDWGCTTVDNNIGGATNTGGSSFLAIDSNGNPWVSYSDTTNTSLKVAQYIGSGGNCTDTSWNCITVDNLGTNSGSEPDMAFDKTGKSWISHHDSANTSLKVARYVGSNGNCTDSAWECTTIDNDIGGTTVTGASSDIIFDSSGVAWIGYFDYTNTSLKVARYVESGGNCTDSAWECFVVTSDLGSTSSTGVESSLAFDSTGKLWIAYTHRGSSALGMAHYVGSGGSCTNTEWECTFIENDIGGVTDSGQEPSLAFDSTDTAWVSYRANTGGLLRVAWFVGNGGNCTDTSWSCTTLDSAGLSQLRFSSIIIDSEDIPWITYWNETDESLRLAKFVGSGGSCADNAWDCTTVDNDIGGTTNTGVRGSLAIDFDGSLWASYSDGTNTSLKVAKLHLPSTGQDSRYLLDRGKAPATESGTCSATSNFEGYCATLADDNDYDSITALANERPFYTFSTQHTNNTEQINASWIGQSTIDPDTRSINIEVFNHTDNVWEALSTTTNSCTGGSQDTDCTLSGSITANLSEYYEADGSNYWTTFRVWQTEHTSTETLRTDAFEVTFGEQEEEPETPGLNQIMRHGVWFKNGVKQPMTF